MRALIVGCGSIGRRHLSNLKSLVESEIFAFRHAEDVDPELSRLGVVRAPTLEDGLSERPDLAIVANPTALHVATASAIAAAGVPFLLEKPVSDRLEGVPELLRRVDEKGTFGLVGYNLRFHPGLAQVRDWLESGRIGRPLSLRVEVGQYLPDWHPSEDYRASYSARRDLGGGVTLDLSHELDLVHWLLGPARELTAVVSRVSDLDIDTEDVAEIVMCLENGSVASVHMDYLQRAPHRSLRLVGSEGTIEWDYYGPGARLYEARGGEWTRAGFESFERNDMYRAEMEHFIRCVRGEDTPVVTLADGATVLELALAARRAAESRSHVRMEGKDS